MTRTLNALAVTFAVVAMSGLLASCSSSGIPHPTSTPRSVPSRTSNPTASPSPETTTTLVLLVSTLPTTFGVPGDTNTYPAAIRVAVPDSFSGQIAAYGVAGTVVVGPSGWTGSGQVGADGSLGFNLIPIGASPGTGPEMVFQFDGACVGCTWGDASSYFPAVASAAPSAGFGPASSPPEGLQTEPLGAGLIGYSLPGSTPAYQVNGVAYTNLPAPTANPIFENLELTLPSTDHTLATVILNALVANEDRYVCASGAASPTISLTLTNGTC
jgi:hypothetical protein